MMCQQPPPLPVLQDAGMQNVERPALPNITSLIWGSMQAEPGPSGLHACVNVAYLSHRNYLQGRLDFFQPSPVAGLPSKPSEILINFL